VPEDTKLVQMLAAGQTSSEESPLPLQKLPALIKRIGDASARNQGQQIFIVKHFGREKREFYIISFFCNVQTSSFLSPINLSSSTFSSWLLYPSFRLVPRPISSFLSWYSPHLPFLLVPTSFRVLVLSFLPCFNFLSLSRPIQSRLEPRGDTSEERGSILSGLAGLLQRTKEAHHRQQIGESESGQKKT